VPVVWIGFASSILAALGAIVLQDVPALVSSVLVIVIFVATAVASLAPATS
jgi:hypothetical protein